MVRPAGPRISSMIEPTFSPGSMLASRRSVDSYEPISEPVPDIWLTNSTSSFSMSVLLTVPRLDMTWEISLISSSSIICQIFSE